MLKRLNTIKEAVTLSKSDQTSMNGGLYPDTANCAISCQSSPPGYPCSVGGHAGCPGVCTGNGGWRLL